MLLIAYRAAIGAILLVFTAVPAFAHTHLLSMAPAADATIAMSPVALVLHFTERVEPGFTGVTLKDSAGKLVPTGTTALDSTDPTTITVPVSAELAAGYYDVTWHALAVDGHKTSGSYGFTVGP